MNPKLWGDTTGWITVNQYYLYELGLRLPYQRCEHMKTKNKRCKRNGRPLCYARRIPNTNRLMGGQHFYCHIHAPAKESVLCNMQDFEIHVSKHNISVLYLKHRLNVMALRACLIEHSMLPNEIIRLILKFAYPVIGE